MSPERIAEIRERSEREDFESLEHDHSVLPELLDEIERLRTELAECKRTINRQYIEGLRN